MSTTLIGWNFQQQIPSQYLFMPSLQFISIARYIPIKYFKPRKLHKTNYDKSDN